MWNITVDVYVSSRWQMTRLGASDVWPLFTMDFQAYKHESQSVISASACAIYICTRKVRLLKMFILENEDNKTTLKLNKYTSSTTEKRWWY